MLTLMVCGEPVTPPSDNHCYCSGVFYLNKKTLEFINKILIFKKMKQIERMELISRIGRELQSRMTYRDIAIYLSGFGIDVEMDTSPIN